MQICYMPSFKCWQLIQVCLNAVGHTKYLWKLNQAHRSQVYNPKCTGWGKMVLYKARHRRWDPRYKVGAAQVGRRGNTRTDLCFPQIPALLPGSPVWLYLQTGLLGTHSGSIRSEDWCLSKRRKISFCTLPPWRHATWGHGRRPSARPTSAPTRTQLCWHPDRQPPGPMTARNQFPPFGPASLWCFVPAARAD